MSFDHVDPDTRRYISKLRAENHGLRYRLKNAGLPETTPLEMLPPKAQTEIKNLRAECTRRRIASRELESENTALKARVATLIADLGDAHQGSEPYHGIAGASL